MIMVLFGLIVAAGVLRIILAIAAIVSGNYTPPSTPQQDVHVDVHVKQDPPATQYPTIAEQLDGRLTNVVRDPMQGIL